MIETTLDSESSPSKGDDSDKSEKETEQKTTPLDKETESSSSSLPINDEREAKIEFKCSVCEHFEMVHYFGCSPYFTIGVQFREPTYILRDPFRPSPAIRKKENGDIGTVPAPEYFVAIGSHCHNCNQMVCKDAECSFYYTRTYCLPCARLAAPTFPAEVRNKFNKHPIK